MMKLRSLLPLTLCMMMPAFGWGADGHMMVTKAAMQSLPKSVPAFLRRDSAVEEVTYLAPEPDRQKGAGKTRDMAFSPGHYADIDDDGRLLGGPKLFSLPETREAYDSELRKAGHSEYFAGYLPYAMVSGYQLLVKDFAAWRVVNAGARLAKSAEEKKAFETVRQYREDILIHDLGVWSHFIGDASQPLHVTVHFNGWGKYPNPEHFTQKPVHGPWESEFVHARISLKLVEAHMPGREAKGKTIWPETEAFLKDSHDAVVPFYTLEKAGAFDMEHPSSRGVAFTADQLGRGAGMLRDLIVQAWAESENASVGWPAVAVSDVEKGVAPAFIP